MFCPISNKGNGFWGQLKVSNYNLVIIITERNDKFGHKESKQAKKNQTLNSKN